MHGNARDLRGQKFGRLTALRPTDKRRWDDVVWILMCACGTIAEIPTSNLVSGKTHSCGCLRKELALKKLPNGGEDHPRYKHGGAGTRLYKTWKGMKTRCYNKNTPCYKYYGGKGIIICEEWLNDFVVFRDWAMSNGYTDELTIDRINSDNNYEPNNCQFLTQAENKRGEKC